MTNRIFISYATGDDDNVVKLYDALSRLGGVEVFVPQYTEKNGKTTHHKIKEALDGSKVSVVLLTFNSTNTMWLNQEIGYCIARNIPIILIAERGLDIVGFLQGSDFIIYQRGNFEKNIYEVIAKLRTIFLHSEFNLSNFYVTCTKCKKKFLEPLLSKEIIDKKLEKGEQISCNCKFCSSLLNVNPMTLSTSE